MHLIPDQGRLYYICCKNCNKSLTARDDWDFPCSACSVKAGYHPRPKKTYEFFGQALLCRLVSLRCRVGVHLEDTTASLCASLLSPYADEIIGYTADQLKEMDEKGLPFEADVAKAINGKNVVCFLKYIDRKYMGNNVRDYPIVKIYIQESNDLQVAAPHEEKTSSQAECDGVVLPAQRVTVSEELFSPTTKKVLDEIATSTEGVGGLEKASAVKKCLHFQQTCPLTPVVTIDPPAYPSLTEEMDLTPPGFPNVIGSHVSTGVVVKVEKKTDTGKASPVEQSDAFGSPVKKMKTKEKLN